MVAHLRRLAKKKKRKKVPFSCVLTFITMKVIKAQLPMSDKKSQGQSGPFCGQKIQSADILPP
jgi:hypothetical protein